LPSAMADVGANFLVDCRGKNVEATVVKTPFYKPADTKRSSGANR
jgi:aminomethyltransferase